MLHKRRAASRNSAATSTTRSSPYFRMAWCASRDDAGINQCPHIGWWTQKAMLPEVEKGEGEGHCDGTHGAVAEEHSDTNAWLRTTSAWRRHTWMTPTREGVVL